MHASRPHSQAALTGAACRSARRKPGGLLTSIPQALELAQLRCTLHGGTAGLRGGRRGRGRPWQSKYSPGGQPRESHPHPLLCCSAAPSAPTGATAPSAPRPAPYLHAAPAVGHCPQAQAVFIDVGHAVVLAVDLQGEKRWDGWVGVVAKERSGPRRCLPRPHY